MLGQVSNQPVI